MTRVNNVIDNSPKSIGGQSDGFQNSAYLENSNPEEDLAVQEFLSEFTPVPDSDVKFLNNGWQFLDIAQVPYKDIRLIPSIGQAKVNGFANNGVSCYMNVIFQFLCNMPGIKEYFLGNIHLKEFQEKANQPIDDNFPNRIGELIQLYHSYNDFVLEPTWLISEIKVHSKTFSSPDLQQDAHEFLMYMLDRLSTSLNRDRKKPQERGGLVTKQASMSNNSDTASNSKARSGSQKKIKKKPSKRNSIRDSTAEKEKQKPSLTPRLDDHPEIKAFESSGKHLKVRTEASKPGQDKETLELLSLDSWRAHLSSNQSIVSDVLLGQFITKLECLVCGASNHNFESFNVIELPLPQGRDTTTLGELLGNLSKEDIVEGFQWDCPKCELKRQVRKSTKIYKLPPVLVVCYKRFTFFQGKFKKNNCLVDLKIDGEDFSKFENGGMSSGAKNYIPYMFIVEFNNPASSW